MPYGNKLKGNRGEDLAADFLIKKGLRILNRNFTTSLGELDIVATDETALIFVEVKSRFTDMFGRPCESVTAFKRRKINQVAAQYIKKFRLFDVYVRFDIVEVYLAENRINHIENAFDSYLHY